LHAPQPHLLGVFNLRTPEDPRPPSLASPPSVFFSSSLPPFPPIFICLSQDRRPSKQLTVVPFQFLPPCWDLLLFPFLFRSFAGALSRTRFIHLPLLPRSLRTLAFLGQCLLSKLCSFFVFSPDISPHALPARFSFLPPEIHPLLPVFYPSILFFSEYGMSYPIFRPFKVRPQPLFDFPTY